MNSHRGRASSHHTGPGIIPAIALLLAAVACAPVTGLQAPAKVLDSISTRPATAAPSSTPPAATPSRAVPTSDPKAGLHARIDWALGPTIMQTGRLGAITYGRYEPGDVVVEWSINNAKRPDWTKRGAQIDAITILRAFIDTEYTAVVLQGYHRAAPLYEPGNPGLLAVSLTFYRATVDNMNWNDYFLPDQIFSLADRAWIAPEFR